MTVLQHITTADELLQKPKDGFLYELVSGELRQMSPSGFEHGKLASNVEGPLHQYVVANRLGIVCGADAGFLLSRNPDTVRAADVAFVRQERIDVTGSPVGYYPGPPDLLVEVISPNDHYIAVDEKVAEWLDAGARMVVVVNPRRKTVKVYRSASEMTQLGENDTLSGADVVPGWMLPVSAIFR